MAEIVLKDIHKYFGTHHVLRGVSLEIHEGNKTGLIGKNGAGKTTLFRIISGEEPYDKGDMQIAKGLRVGILDQIPQYPDDATVYQVLDSAFQDLRDLKTSIDALQAELAANPGASVMGRYGALLSEFESRGGYEIETRIRRVCTGLDIGQEMQDKLFSKLSGGEKTRVNLARIILMDPHILLLDEPTNHLDIRASEWLEEYLQSFKGTVLVISHDRYFLDRVVNRIIEIEDGVAETYEGNYSRYALLKEQKRLEQLKHYEQEQRKIRQLEAAVKRMHEWANRADSAKMHRRAFSMEKRLERMKRDGTSKPKVERKISRGFRAESFSGSDVAMVKDLRFSYGSSAILNGVDLLVRRNERLALIGNNGSGKTTLLRIIMGELVPDEGIVKTGVSVKTGYLPQKVEFDNPGMTVLDTVRHELIIDEGSARNILAGFMFKGEDVFKTVDSLSGGELSRLKLCLLMQRDVNFLILDEPTNHLDIQSREWIEEALDAFEGTILFVSHDRYFIRKFASSVCELEDGKLLRFDGDYESFREYRRIIEEERKREASVETRDDRPRQERIRKPSPKTLEKKLAAIEADISETEALLLDIEQEMEQHAADYVRLEELLSEKDSLSARLEELYGKWMETHQLMADIEP
ncbi:MAG TPA: ABC-F type ribosomal protection protein [Thermoclostridium sp.]|nr:ABC-F type ribosomal protection protein [Thermoclostridium sp.]